MFKDTKELAEILDGRQYRSEITKEEVELAKELGIVVVFGAGDDLVEFRGAIEDERSCYGGGKFFLTGQGGLVEYCSEECCHYKKELEKSVELKAVWNDEGSPCWRYDTKIKNERFSIIEDDEVYCEGIVFYKSDIASNGLSKTVIKINDELRIVRTSDNLQWQIQELHIAGAKSKEAGKKIWKGNGYYTKLEHACEKCFKLVAGRAGEVDISNMIQTMKKIKNDI
jgi:hypothetical protein